MAGSFVGLDIGSNQIKVAEVRRNGNQVQVVALGIAPTPPEAYENNVVVDVQLLGQAVKNLLKQSGITTKDCVSSVAGPSSVVVRVIEVPQMNTAELAETMKWEVERHVPFAASEVIMDYTPIDRPEGYAEGQNMDVLLAVAQQDMVDRHVEMLMAAGLKPKYIDVEPLALGRTLLDLEGSPSPAGHTVAIVNLGATNTDIDIYRDKLLAFPRSLPLAGDSFTRAIAETLHVDLNTAEQYKKDYGEVILDQFGQQQQQAGFGGAVGSGFVDFSGQPPANPFDTSPSGQVSPFPPPVTGPQSSPSGRMPFDFSTPGDAPAPSPFDTSGQPAPPNPFGAPQDQAPSGDFMQPGAPQDGGMQPAEPGFMTPVGAPPPPPAQNLPAPSGGSGDPQRDAMRLQVFSAIAPVLAELAQELRRSIDYYRGRTSDAQIHELRLTGGTSRLRNLAPFLEMELGIPTRVADTLQNVQVTAKSFSDTYMQEVSSQFPISIGLGVRDLIGGPAPAKKRK
ncbi:MAG TPA: type IV pilus assembly protein PilM [Chthonomonadaceae bacterium]|nr:type IV pilus assembly protein PilM [Chthonomonadaceae bacterium]